MATNSTQRPDAANLRFALHRGGSATWCRETLDVENGKWKHGTKDVQVRVMAIAEGYAMVRVKGAMPIVVSTKRLSPNSQAQEALPINRKREYRANFLWPHKDHAQAQPCSGAASGYCGVCELTVSLAHWQKCSQWTVCPRNWNGLAKTFMKPEPQGKTDGDQPEAKC